MMEYLSDLRLFREICKTLNFRQAGEKLGYSPAVVSMRVKRLETVTGKTLLLRSTRQITVTEEGRELLALAEKTLDLAELMTSPREPMLAPESLKGHVRICAPHSFARVFLVNPIAEIQRCCPHLTLELLLEDNITHLVEAGIDISFRVGGEGEAGTNCQDLLDDKRILLASPSYLENNGLPIVPADIERHQCLSYTGMKQWSLESTDDKQRIELTQVLFCNTGDYLTQLAVAGVGITAKSEWSVADSIAAGKLQRVLPAYSLGPVHKVWVLTPKRDVTPVRVRWVLDKLKQHIAHTHDVMGLDY